MTIRRLVSGTLAWALIGVVGCGGSGGPTSLDDGGPSVVQSVEVVENDSVTVQAAATSDTVTGVLRDAAGDPVAGGLSSWEVEGGSDAECGFWEATTLESDSSGRVRNTLHAGKVAWTATGPTPDCRYRVVHSSQGAPEPVLDSVVVRVEPGPPGTLVAERSHEGGTRDQFGDDGDALAQFGIVWRDRFQNPSLFEAAVTSGPAEAVSEWVKQGITADSWMRAVRATGEPGTGTVEVWSLPDSSRTISGTFEVTAYGPNGQERWICVTFDSFQRDNGPCEGPPDL